MPRSFVLVSILALACATPEGVDRPEFPAPGVLTLGADEAELRDAFNAHSELPQLVVILSPT